MPLLLRSLIQKSIKSITIAQALPDTPENLFSSRSSLGKHILKILENPCMGLCGGTPTKFMTQKS